MTLICLGLQNLRLPKLVSTVKKEEFFAKIAPEVRTKYISLPCSILSKLSFSLLRYLIAFNVPSNVINQKMLPVFLYNLHNSY